MTRPRSVALLLALPSALACAKGASTRAGVSPLGGDEASMGTAGASDATTGGSPEPGAGGRPGDASGTSSAARFFCDLPGDVPGAVVPSGFCIRRFADVATPRVLAFAPSGEVFVASPSVGTPGGAPAGIGGIYVLADDDRDGAADSPRIFLASSSLASVHGLAFLGDSELLYTVADGVYALPYAPGDRDGTRQRPERIADLSSSTGGGRWTHTLAIAADGSILVSRGQFDATRCPPADPRAGAVLRIGLGHPPSGDVAISGLRNPMYLRCAPWGTCYAAELSGDGWTGIGGAEKLVEIVDGVDFGYPCCVDRAKPVPGLSPAPDCARAGAGVQAYPLHDTPFGFDWDGEERWPVPYTGGLFFGFHGSFFEGPWNGTRVGWAPVDPVTHRPAGAMQTLVSGFGVSGPIVGRVTDVRMAPDGRLFFSDDTGGAVYWVAPVGLERPR